MKKSFPILCVLLGLLCLFYSIGAVHADVVPVSPIAYGLVFGVLIIFVAILVYAGWRLLRWVIQERKRERRQENGSTDN